MKPVHAALFSLALAACATAATPPAAPDPAAGLDEFLAVYRSNPADPAEFSAYCDAALARAGALRTALETATGPTSVEGDFRTYDNLYRVLDSVSNDSGLVSQTSPNAEIRAAAETCLQQVAALGTEIGLSRPLFDRLSAIDAGAAPAYTQLALTRALADYRRAGVDRDEATRARITELQNEIVEIGLEFDRNIRDDQTEITFPSVAALAGLPQDYIDRHQPGADGLVHISTAYPDVFPILNYATNADTRRAVYTAFRSRAYPVNAPVLARLMQKRHELAQLLGFANYAELITADKMIGTPQRAQSFIDELAAASREAAQRDYQRQVRRLAQIERGAREVPLWSVAYVQTLIRREQYNLDSQEVRQYFAYDNVRDGMFALTEDLFGVDIRPWEGAPVWHESVEAYELYEGGQLIGRFILDMHPREGKFSHAANFPIRNGVAGHSVPLGALICNFPAGDHSTGLMEHGDVETFLHEFGHLLHGLFSGRQTWAQQQYGEVEWDFIEAPSTLLEEWVWDYDTLATFAVNAQGQTIPRDLVERMNEARNFGEAQGTLTQLAYSAISLNYYNRDPAGVDLYASYRDNFERYSLAPFAAESHPYASFGHLNGYSAIYYTYQWSQSIALDMFTRFDAEGMRNRETARAYRELVLEPGGSRPAGELIESFLGRPMSLDAYRARLQQGNAPPS